MMYRLRKLAPDNIEIEIFVINVVVINYARRKTFLSKKIYKLIIKITGFFPKHLKASTVK